MPLIKPYIPSSPPPRPKPHFGGEGTPTPISSKFPQSSSAGSTINPADPSHLGDPSLLRGSAAGNTGHASLIPSPLPPKRPGSPELPNDRFKATEQQIQAYDGKKRLDLTDYFAEDGSKIQDLRKGSDGDLYFIDEHDYSFLAELYKDDVTRVMIYDPYGVNDTIFLRLFNDGHYRQVNSWLPEPSPSPQLPLSPHQPEPSNVPDHLWRPWLPDGAQSSPQSGSSTTPKRPYSPDGAQPLPPRGGMDAARVPPELTNGSEGFWRNKHPETRQLAANLFRDGKIHDVTYLNGGREINGTFNYKGNEYRFSCSVGGKSRVALRDMAGNSADIPGINGLYFTEFLREIGSRTSVPLTGEVDAARVPPELTHGSGNFWENRKPATRQLAVSLFRDGRIRDVTYGNNGREINGTFNYGGNEYRFSYSVGSESRVALRDMAGNSADLPGINGLYFAEFLREIESRTSVPLIGGAPAPARPRLPIMIRQNMPNNFSIPDELNPPAARDFWARIGDSNTQFLLTELYRNREIYRINFDIGTYGNPRLNAVMRYQGRDYAFYVSADRRIRFSSGIVPLPNFPNGGSFYEALLRLASQTVPNTALR